VKTRVLPMCDGALRTWVNGMPLQEFLIRRRGEGQIQDVAFREDEDEDDDATGPTPEVLAALAQARAVIIGPSNPVISIWPILIALGDALANISAPVVCVSPIVGGKVLKGPTAAFLTAMRLPANAAGVAAYYNHIAEGLLDGMVADESVPAGRPWGPEDTRIRSSSPSAEMSVPADLATLRIDTAMPDEAARARVAEQVLDFADSLAG
jgi:LPPG:FO 2-phospho-L-lactate transferase